MISEKTLKKMEMEIRDIEEKMSAVKECIADLRNEEGEIDWVPVVKAAKIIQCSVANIYALIRNNKLETRQIANKIYINRSSLQKL